MSGPLFWLSAGGGSGTTTIRTCVGFGTEVSSLRVTTGLVVVVCRSTARGLTRAQQIAVANSGGSLMAGLVINADAPGKLPRPLEDLARLVSGGFTDTWRIPWVEAWRLGAAPDWNTAPAGVRRMAEELAFATDTAPSATPIATPVLAQPPAQPRHRKYRKDTKW